VLVEVLSDSTRDYDCGDKLLYLDLPVFDTALPDLNLVQLFRTNRYVGADRLGDANELAAGVTTRLTSAESGRQYLTATIGQRFYFESPEVTLPGELPETRNTSNLIGEIEMTAWRDWSARIAMEYDRSESNTLLGQAHVQYKPRPDTVVNLGYRYREALLEQWDASVAWRLSRSWQVFARQVYSTKESESIDRFAGFEYSGCCWGIRLIGRNAFLRQHLWIPPRLRSYPHPDLAPDDPIPDPPSSHSRCPAPPWPRRASSRPAAWRSIA
jgi:LPS-assembly protein